MRWFSTMPQQLAMFLTCLFSPETNMVEDDRQRAGR